MNQRIRWAALATLLIAVPVLAQDTGPSLFQRLAAAGRLPTVTKEARTLGVPESDLLSIFGAARDNRLSAGSLADLFSVENDAIRKNGRIDNFGSFVQGRLAAGLRGRDLADAIHAEHARRGMGKGSNRGMSGDHGMSGEKGMSDDHGKSGDRGKPESPGKSGENRKKGGK